MGKKYILSLLSAILVLWNCVKSSKISSYFELFWIKYFHFGWQNVSNIFQYFCQDLTDRLFTYLLKINIKETCTVGIKCSDDEEFRIFKL